MQRCRGWMSGLLGLCAVQAQAVPVGAPGDCTDLSAVAPFTQFRFDTFQSIFDALQNPKDPNSGLCSSCHPGSIGAGGLGLGAGFSYGNAGHSARTTGLGHQQPVFPKGELRHPRSRRTHAAGRADLDHAATPDPGLDQRRCAVVPTRLRRPLSACAASLLIGLVATSNCACRWRATSHLHPVRSRSRSRPSA